jgi:hypothetical protein
MHRLLILLPLLLRILLLLLPLFLLLLVLLLVLLKKYITLVYDLLSENYPKDRPLFTLLKQLNHSSHVSEEVENY